MADNVERTDTDALALFERYAQHDKGCARYRHDFKVRFRDIEPTCLCGYEAACSALAALAGRTEVMQEALEYMLGYPNLPGKARAIIESALTAGSDND
jgi:hypothetical protein